MSIALPHKSKAEFECYLNDAYISDNYSEAAKAWNEERSRVVQEALDQHVIPHGSKWTREWLQEEIKDLLAAQCGEVLWEVSTHHISPVHFSDRFSAH